MPKLLQTTPISLGLMVDISIVSNGIINQLITGGHHLVGVHDISQESFLMIDNIYRNYFYYE